MKSRESQRRFRGLVAASVASMVSAVGLGCSADDDDAGDAGADPAVVTEVRAGTVCNDGPGRVVLSLQLMPAAPGGAVAAAAADFSLANARLEPLADPAAGTALATTVRALEAAPTGGAARADDDRLVVLLVDNSAGTDSADARIDLLKATVRRPDIPSDTYFSLVWFNGRQPTLTPDFGTPTRNRDVLVCPSGADGETCAHDAQMDGLAKLAGAEAEGTPLADALARTYETLVDRPELRDLNPVVVLVTDGVEDGDTSGSGATLESAAARYAGHTFGGAPSPVPVIVVHLRPAAASGAPQGPDPALHALSCATGGEYHFVESPAGLADPDALAAQLAARIAGVWRLGVDVDAAPTEPAWLETELTATLGGSTLTANPRLFASP